MRLTGGWGKVHDLPAVPQKAAVGGDGNLLNNKAFGCGIA
jgi:hypothetical protein